MNSDIGAVVFAVAKRWWIVVIGAAVCVVAMVLLSFLQKDMYESSLTVLVMPPPFKQETAKPDEQTKAQEAWFASVMPRSIPIQALRSLALSKSIFAQVIADLGLDNATPESLSKRCFAELIPVGVRGADYVPSIEFRARGYTPERAAAIVQTWADIFKKHVDRLVTDELQRTHRTLDEICKAADANLVTAEDAFKSFKSEWNTTLMQTRLTAKEQQVTRLEDCLVSLEIKIARQQALVERLDTELAKEQRVDVLFKAPPDEAYWLSPRKSGADALTPLSGLKTEEINPNYETLREESAVAGGELSALQGEHAKTSEQISQLNASILELQKTLAERGLEYAQLERDVANLKETFMLAAVAKGRAEAALASQMSDLIIAGEAPLPEQAVGGKLGLKVFAAALVGALLGLSYIALSMSLRRWEIENPEPAS